MLFVSCSSVPKHFEKEKRGIRHISSRVLYPRIVGNYSFFNHDASQALSARDKEGRKSAAVYMDYKSGGPMTSILYRPFAKVETFIRPKNVKFDVFVSKEVAKLTKGKKILVDTWSKNKKGDRYRLIKLSADQGFLTEGFGGTGHNEKIPAVTRIVFLDKGEHVLFMTTSYPANDEETHAKPNRDFVAKFIEAQK